MIVIGKVKWCHTNQLANVGHKKYKPCWKVDVYPIDAVEEAKLESLGIKKHEDDDGNTYYRVKRNETKNDGVKNTAPVVRDKSNQPFNGNVGNGSVCKVQYTPFDYDGDTYLFFQGIQVLELVEFGVKDGDEFGDETGEDEFKNEEKGKEEKTYNPF